jgi:hypothetical protein
MDIQKIVEQAFKNGYLTPEMESKINQICDSTNSQEISIEEYRALDRLMGALLLGDVMCDNHADADELDS